MPNLRLIGGSAAFAFILSLVSGIIGGVGFLTILLRALSAAVAFAALITGIYILLENMIPELFSETETADAADGGDISQTAKEGGNVDITLEGGEEEGEGGTAQPDFAVDGMSPDEEEAEEEGFVEEMAESAPGEGVEGAEEEQEEAAEAKEEAQASAGGASASNSSSGSDSEEGTTSEEEEETEEVESVDTLPDLEDFAESFEGVAESQKEDSSSNEAAGARGASGPSEKDVDVMGDQQDPETVAKAVRTIMNKDQEG